jgi:hypothetical protein
MNFGHTSTVERTRAVDTPLVLLWARLELNQLASRPGVYSASRFPETNPEPINDESRLGHTGRLSTGNKPREKRPTSPAPDCPMRGDSGHNLAPLRSRETWVGWIASRSASVSIPSMVQGARTVKYGSRLSHGSTMEVRRAQRRARNGPARPRTYPYDSVVLSARDCRACGGTDTRLAASDSARCSS